MEKSANLYMDISKNILDILNNDNLDDDSLEKCFENRENIIKDLERNNKIDEFRKIYREKLFIIDDQIKSLFEMKILDTKKEIADYKRRQSANSNYVNMNKKDLNIFSKKV